MAFVPLEETFKFSGTTKALGVLIASTVTSVILLLIIYPFVNDYDSFWLGSAFLLLPLALIGAVFLINFLFQVIKCTYKKPSSSCHSGQPSGKKSSKKISIKLKIKISLGGTSVTGGTISFWFFSDITANIGDVLSFWAGVGFWVLCIVIAIGYFCVVFEVRCWFVKPSSSCH